MAMTRHCKNGFFMTELLIACAVMLLVTAMVLLQLPQDSGKRDVDVLVREMAMDIQRMRQYSLTNGQATGDNWALSYDSEKYIITKQYFVKKERYLPKGVTISSNSATKKNVTFDEKGRPTHAMQLVVEMPEISYSKKIILAAQTGRIRIE